MTRPRVLFISPLDRRVVANTREENIAQMLEEAGYERVSLTLAQNTSRQLRDIVMDSLSWRCLVQDGGNVYCVDPPLNPCTGLHTNMQHASSSAPSTPGTAKARPSWAKRCIGYLAPLGIVRDWVIIPAVLVHALRRGRFELCIAYGPWAACVAWLLRASGRVTLVVYDDQDYEPAIMRNRWRQRWAAFLERTMMRKADTVVSVGQRLAALRRQQTGLPITVISNGVHLTPDAASTPSATADRPHPPEGAPLRLVYVGNVVPWSGLDCMLRALVQVRAQGVDVRVQIIGDGLPSYLDELRSLVSALALADTVQLVGRIPNAQVQSWLRQADVGLAHFRPEPYRQYAFPLKVVEYMQAGLAVIGTQDTETEDLLHLHDIGIAVPFSEDGIAHAIVALAQDATQRQRYQANALQAVHHYQWRALAAQQLALVERVARERGIAWDRVE